MPRCGQASRMAKYFPAAVRPNTSGMPSRMAFAMRLPATSDARSAGYQSPYSRVAVGPEGATCARVASPIMCVKSILSPKLGHGQRIMGVFHPRKPNDSDYNKTEFLIDSSALEQG